MTGIGSGGQPLEGLLTIMWHYVRDAADRPAVGAGRVEPATFDRQLDAIAAARAVVGWGDVVDALEGRRALPPDAALLTFDDGLVDHHAAVLPRLVARGWPAIVFATARRSGDRLSVGHRIHVLLADRSPARLRLDVLDRLGPADRSRFLGAERREAAAGLDELDILKRVLQRDLSGPAGPILSGLIEEQIGTEADVADALHLSRTQLDELDESGLTVGGHGLRHLWLDHEPAIVVRREIDASATFLARRRRPWAFAYPYGAASLAAIRGLARHPFRAAFLARPVVAAATPAATHPFGLGRVDAEGPDFEAALRPGGAGWP